MNDSMGKYIAEQVVKAMIKKDIPVNRAKVLMLGITFKENCPDVRNTKIVDVVAALEDFGAEVSIYDPWANPAELKHEYGLDCINELSNVRHPEPVKGYDAIVLGVAHNEFLKLDLKDLCKENAVVYDVKGLYKDTNYSTL